MALGHRLEEPEGHGTWAFAWTATWLLANEAVTPAQLLTDPTCESSRHSSACRGNVGYGQLSCRGDEDGRSRTAPRSADAGDDDESDAD